MNPSPIHSFDSGRVFLIGYRGCGKTTVARLLAERLGWNWLDADTVLAEREGRSIRRIFGQEGEPFFRRLEGELLREFCQTAQHVIATGGGVILDEENRQRMRDSGFIVWLDAPAATLWRRLQSDTRTQECRPNLTIGGLPEIEELLKVREPLYRQCAHLHVNTDERTPEEIVSEIMKKSSCL